ncbi:MAG: hypothetical protein AAF721_11730 [Myxococcota bacterium]
MNLLRPARWIATALALSALPGCDRESATEAEAKAKTPANDPPAEPVVSPIPQAEWALACSDYATMCPRDPEPKCIKTCPALRFPERHEQCSFIYCATKVDKCDNEEEDDKSIMACIDKRGWGPRGLD